MPGATSMVVIGITALIVFGPSKLPDIGRAFGHSCENLKMQRKELYRMTTKNSRGYH
ncbi:twin-arginine translocase TatA/TatE family subunit [Priestia megaterium]